MPVHAGKLRPAPHPDKRTAIYTPSPWGATFHSLRCREAMGAGAAGPGKTTVLLNDCWDQIVAEHERCRNKDHPYHQPWGYSTGWALHLRRTVKMLEQTIVKSSRIFKAVDPGAHYDSTKNTWVFSSGFRYQFGHCKDSNSWNDYMSAEFTALFFDELVQFEEAQYMNIEGRLRSTDPVLMHMLKCRAMSNPRQRQEGEESFSFRGDPNWVRKYYIDPAPEGRRYLVRTVTHPDGEQERRKRIYLPARLEDNPDKAFVKQYRGTLLTKSASIQEALLRGNWYITAGSYFAETWNQQLNVCDDFKVPRDWVQFRSMDWGYKVPGCVHWYGMDDDDNLFVTRELVFQKKTDEQVCEMIKVIEKDMGLWRDERSIISGPADTQLWEERGGNGKTMAEVFAEHGIYWTKAEKGAGSRRADAQRVAKRLDDHDKGTTTPGLVFFRSCSYAIRTIPAIQTEDDHETPQDGGEDHAFDSVRYGTRYASRGRAAIGRAPIDIEDEEDDEMGESERLNGGGDRGSYGYGGL